MRARRQIRAAIRGSAKRARLEQREAEALRDGLRRGVLGEDHAVERIDIVVRERVLDRRRAGFGRVALAPRSRMECPADLDARASRPARDSAFLRARGTYRSPSLRPPIALFPAAPTARATAPSRSTPARVRRRREDAATAHFRALQHLGVRVDIVLTKRPSMSRSVSTVGQRPHDSAAGDGGDDAHTSCRRSTGVSMPCRKRMSSSATNTLTKRRSAPFSSNRRSAKPGCCASSAFKRLGDGRRLDLHLGRVPREAAQLRRNANGHSSSGAPRGLRCRTRRGTRRA